MIDPGIWKKAWSLLDKRERRNAFLVLGVVILGAFASAVMVGSVMPFLTVLSDPGKVETSAALSWIYETFGFTSNYTFVVALGFVSLGLILAANTILVVQTWAVARFATMRMHSLSLKLLDTYLRHPYSYFLTSHTDDMAARILSESQQLVQQFFRPAADLVASSLTVLAVTGLLIWVEPVIAVVVIGVLGCAYGFTYMALRRFIRRIGKERVQANSLRFRTVREALGGVKEIKLLGRESSYVRRYDRAAVTFARSQAQMMVSAHTPRFVMQALAFSGVVLLCLSLVTPETLGSGGSTGTILPLLGVFAFGGQRLMPELQRFYAAATQLQYGSAGIERIHLDLSSGRSLPELPETIPAQLRLTRSLELDRIAHHYDGGGQPGLADISLKIEAGQRIGIVGGTGAGKTTLANVILGLLQPSQGRTNVDGTEIGPDLLRAWQQSVGYVPQDIFLADAAVSENIALGVPPEEIDHDRVIEAARTARIDAFIRADLPEGYKTMIGERGVRLSGGQRQRLGIARALYHDADLIVFDEATSALDTVTESEVMEAIETLSGKRTILIIAHRLSTVKSCDRILVLERGRIAGYGSWEDLSASNESFQRLLAAAKAS